MLIDTAPPTQESPRKSDADTYAYSASSTSFITVLSEVNAPDDSTDTPPAKAIENDSQPTEETESTAESEEVADGDSTEETTQTNSETEEVVPDESTPDTSTTPDTEAVDTALENTPLPEPPHSETPANETNSTPNDTAVAIPTPSETLGAPAEIPKTAATEGAPPISSVLAGSVNAEGLVNETTTASSDGDEAPQKSGQSPGAPFPKTLNALLAEKAVKQATSDIPEAPPASATSAPKETTATAERDTIPSAEAPPLSQNTATELGGVRTTTPTAPPRIPLSNLPGEIATQINLIQREGTSTMRLRLSPENLGEIRLEVQRIGDTVRVTMISSSPHVRDALDSQMANLRQALGGQGLELSEALVEDSPHQGNEDPPMPRKAPNTTITDSTGNLAPSAPKNAAHVAPSGLNVLA